MKLLYLDVSHEGQEQTSKIITVYKDLIEKYPSLPPLNKLPENKKIYQNGVGETSKQIERYPDILLESDSGEHILFEADYKSSAILSRLAELRVYGLYVGTQEVKITEYNIIWFAENPNGKWAIKFRSDELNAWKKLIADMIPKSVKRANIYFFGANEFKYEIIKIK